MNKMLNRLSEALSSFREVLHIENEFDYLTRVNLIPTVIRSERRCTGIETILDPYKRSPYVEKSDIFDKNEFLKGTPHEQQQVFSNNLIISKLQNINIPLTEAEAVSASKSNIHLMKSLHDFGKSSFNNHFSDWKRSRDEYFNYCFDAGIGEGKTDFTISHWEPVLTWSNSGGSHRFACAHYLAKTYGYKASIPGTLTSYCLNHDWLELMNRDFDMFILTCDGYESAYALRKAFAVSQRTNPTIFEICTLNINIHNDKYNRVETFILILNKSENYSHRIRNWILDNDQLIDLYEISQRFKRKEQESIKNMKQYLTSE